MIELACTSILFHFNKKHLEDQTIPMWVLVTKGKTYYCDHVDCRVSWSTKERYEHPSTKGAIALKNALLTIDDENTAIITTLTDHDKIRLRNRSRGITRIITSYGTKLIDSIKQLNIKHSTIKKAGGGCSTLWFICDIFNKEDVTALHIVMGSDFRELMENEYYYKGYDQNELWIDGDEYWEEDEDEDEIEDDFN